MCQSATKSDKTLNKAHSWGEKYSVNTMVRKRIIRDMHRVPSVHFTQPHFRVGHMQETSSLLLSQEVQRGCWWQSDKCQGWGEAEVNIT